MTHNKLTSIVGVGVVAAVPLLLLWCLCGERVEKWWRPTASGTMQGVNGYTTATSGWGVATNITIDTTGSWITNSGSTGILVDFPFLSTPGNVFSASWTPSDTPLYIPPNSSGFPPGLKLSPGQSVVIETATSGTAAGPISVNAW